MDVETMNLFFALATFLALGGAAVALTSAFASRGPLLRLRGDLGDVGLWLAAAVATTATLGSLYYSEVAGYTPCKLCWFQRIAMYPLVAILGIAAARRDRSVRVYAMPLAAAGLAVSVYHYQLQLFPAQATICSFDNPCTIREVEQFGFVTIPFMAGAGFVAVLALLTVAGRALPPASPEGLDAGEPVDRSPEEVLAR